MTFELFREWFNGYKISDESDKRLCIKYIVPWLINLGKIYSGATGDDQVVNKTKEILQMLIETTVNANETVQLHIHITYKRMFIKYWNTYIHK